VTSPIIIGGFREAEKYTWLSRRTLGRLLPEIDHVRIGSRVLFTRSGLDDFLSRHRVHARPRRKVADAADVVVAVQRGRRKR